MFLEHISLTTDWSKSTAMTNNNGESGSPCRTPDLQTKWLPGTPFKRTEEEPVDKMLLIQPVQRASKPVHCKILRMASCSSVSKAFVKSSLRRMMGHLDALHWWIYSKHQARQYWIERQWRKPYWLRCIHLRITFCSRLASSLVRNFKHVFVKDISLKSPSTYGLSFLGTKVIKELLRHSKLHLPS